MRIMKTKDKFPWCGSQQIKLKLRTNEVDEKRKETMVIINYGQVCGSRKQD